jgi:hypothetical protein
VKIAGRNLRYLFEKTLDYWTPIQYTIVNDRGETPIKEEEP